MDRQILHICDELSKINKAMEDGVLDHSFHYGMAITHIEYSARHDNKLREPARGWVAHNGEYGTFINYCPFCGARLEAATND
jgi:hypothetical protein